MQFRSSALQGLPEKVPLSHGCGQSAVILVSLAADTQDFWRAIETHGDALLSALLKAWLRHDRAIELLEAAMAIARLFHERVSQRRLSQRRFSCRSGGASRVGHTPPPQRGSHAQGRLVQRAGLDASAYSARPSHLPAGPGDWGTTNTCIDASPLRTPAAPPFEALSRRERGFTQVWAYRIRRREMGHDTGRHPGCELLITTRRQREGLAKRPPSESALWHLALALLPYSFAVDRRSCIDASSLAFRRGPKVPHRRRSRRRVGCCLI